MTDEARLARQIAAARRKISLYQDILANNRRIIDFDPSGNGRIAELIGTVGPNTTNVGVLVSGTGTNAADFNRYAANAASFVTANQHGDLAMVVWAGDGSPHAQAADLAAFSHRLRDQVDQQAGPDNDVRITYAGHGYGGAVVGLAERNGLAANRTLYVESAGMGRGGWSPSDLPDARPDVPRYAMTAPGDPISVIHGTRAFGPGATDLATGNYPNGRPIIGLAAHNGVFTTGSDAWRNMYAVFTGGPVTPRGR